MKKQLFLADYITMADIQAKRLHQALIELKPLVPFSPEQLELSTVQQVAFLDMLTTRFGKLQDIIGAHIFSLLLELLGEEAPAFIDKLNKLEKLEYIDNANWWIELRKIRNQITHEYPDNVLLCEHLNAFIPKTQDLLNYWSSLKEKITSLQK